MPNYEKINLMHLSGNIILLCFLFFSLIAHGQSRPHRNSILHIDKENGLPNEWIRVLHQDHHGFIWIGTENGLCRYDGHEFLLFQHDEDDPCSIPFNYITMIQEDTAHHHLLIGGIKSIARMNLKTFTFSPLISPPGHAASSTNRRFIIDNTGHTWLYREDGYFIMHTPDSFEWVYPATGYFPIKYADGILHRDKNGLIYLQAKEPHVLEINKKNKLPPDKNNEIVLVNIPIPMGDVADTLLDLHNLPPSKWFIQKNHSPNLFLKENALWSYDANQRTASKYFDTKDYFKEDSAVNLLWYQRLQDQTLLLGTSHGLLAIPGGENPFQLFSDVRARKIKYYRNSIWLSGDQGLFQYAEGGTLLKKWSSEKMYSFEFDGDHLYGGTRDGKLIYINLNTGKTKMISLATTNPGIRNLYFTGIIKDKIYFGGTPYLIRTNRDLTAVKFISMTDIQGRSHTDILCGHLLEDKNELWLGTITGGVFVFTVSDSLIFKKQLYKNTNKENALTSDGVLDMMRSRDKMYLCMEAGINIVDLNINSIISIRKKSGLVDDRIMSTLSDGKGNIWLSTLSNGLIQWNTSANTFKSTTVSNGLISDNHLFGSGMVDPGGKMYFGSEEGVYRFDPGRQIEPTHTFDSILISNCYINGYPFYSVTGDTIKNILFKPFLQLNHNQNRIQLALSGSALFNMPDVQYSLLPKDKTWYKWKSGDQVLYDGLAPGKYLFRTKINGRERAHLTFNISPPWYKTMLFLFLFGLATLGSLGYLIYAYIQYRLRLQRLRLQAELVETKANYFANITHELKTPLQLLTGPLENLHSKLSTDLGNEKLITWLDTAQKQAQRIKILVQQMETLKKIDEAVLTDHIEPIDLFAFADGIKNSFEALALKQNLRIHVESNLNSSLIVQMDHSHLTTIFNNLIQNVLDHSATAKNIWIRLFDEKDQVNIEIQDDGEGILPADRPYIFNRFYTKAANGKGMGLGLALVHDLVRWHQGTIEYQATDGDGRFLIKFPLNQSESMEYELEKINIKEDLVIIDNEASILEFIKNEMESLYHIHLFTSAPEALKYIYHQLPGIIITDWLMPGMDGIDFVKKIKQSPLTCHIPIIMISGKSDTGSRLQAYESNVDAYLSKPFSIHELKVLLSQILENRKTIASQNLKSSSSRPSGSEDPFVPMLMEYLDLNLANAELNVDQICRGMTLSRTQLFRKCIASFGVSVQQLLQTKRINKAKELLTKFPLKTISEVALSCGYKDPNYFSKVFKKESGMNPVEYKQSQKTN